MPKKAKIITDFAVESNAIYSATDLLNGRIQRTTMLYTAGTGMVPIAMQVKKYVKSVFNSTSSEYKQVSGIQFTHPVK